MMPYGARADGILPSTWPRFNSFLVKGEDDDTDSSELSPYMGDWAPKSAREKNIRRRQVMLGCRVGS